MSSISKVSLQMVVIFALACAWAVTSGWKQQVMSAFEANHSNRTTSILSAKKQDDFSSKASVSVQTRGRDIDPVTSLAQ